MARSVEWLFVFETAGTYAVEHTWAMTELEAEALAERLERIWRPKSIRWRLASPPLSRANSPNFLYLQAILPDSLQLLIEGERSPFIFSLVDEGRDYGLYFNEQGQLDQSLFDYEEATEDAHRQARFAAEWMDVFRRGCWLSGCPIEATMHEKAEWVQEFMKEELDAWKLKM